MVDYRVLDAAAIGRLHDARRDFGYDVLVGLSERPKRLPSRYFYDDEGSRLFQRIMALPEYYLTACEREILEAHAGSIAERIAGRPVDVIDLGAGDGDKTLVLLGELARRGADFRYVPIDISEAAMKAVLAAVEADLPGVRAEGVVSEYVDGIHWLGREREGGRRALVLFLGSNIGNFDRPHARALLRRMWTALRPGDRMLIGFDLKKDIDVLLAAYNDEAGVTAAFNLNLLSRINRELGGGFDLDAWRHFGTYDVFSGAMKSYLVSRERQRVEVAALSQVFDFEPWEPVHTEYSYKYLRSDVTRLAADTGFEVEAEHLDERGWFVDSLWRVPARD